MSLNNPFNGKIAGFDEDRITTDKVKEDCLSQPCFDYDKSSLFVISVVG